MSTGATGSATARANKGCGQRQACRQLAEKDLLLRELGHRVRNSLTVIASLACIESAGVEDKRALAGIERLKSRVASTALLYEKLETGKGKARLRADLYIEEIVNLAVDSLSVRRDQVQVSTELAPIKLGAKVAGSLGLIVNEAVTNAFKYGIIAGGGKRLHVSLGAGPDGMTRLVVEDDGPGFPAGFDPGSDGDFGFELMQAEAQGLGGTVMLSAEGPGARVEVLFHGDVTEGPIR